MKLIGLLGATGSIGTQTLDIIRNNPEYYKLVSMSSGRNIDLTRKIITEFKPQFVSVQEKAHCEQLKSEFPHITISYGNDGLIDAAVHSKVDIVINAVMGSVGLEPTLMAIEAGKTIGLANKETLVTAGHIVMDVAKQKQVPIIPVDSEHSAIFQCLNGESKGNVSRLILTASGGSFRDLTREELREVTVEQALAHPNWSMGSKITIDSATMMNKGLEVIEAYWLFGIAYDQIDVIQHRESIIHSMVEYHDSSVIAQLGSPDMRVPIQYALSYPERLPLQNGESLDLVKIGKLHFEEMDTERFPCLRFAYEAGKIGGSMPTVLNAANEVAVNQFLNGKISFLMIENLIEKALTHHQNIKYPDLRTIREVDSETRNYVHSLSL